MPLPAELQQAYVGLDDFDALLNAGDFATALARIANAEVVLAQHGVRSAHLKYLSSAIAGRLGQHLEALDFISAALELDPLNPTTQHRRYVTLNTISNAMKGAGSTSPFIVPWYQALVAEDCADASVHETYARHLLATKRPTEALRILDALAVLSPSAATVASLRADALAASGDEPAARQSREVAAELAEDRFAVPQGTA